MNVNQHGLSRHIPAAIRRAVRQRDGFGCVICGSALIDYEHFDPEFAQAKEHDADGIILLCTAHHRQKGTFLSEDTIRKAMDAPAAKARGFSFGPLDPGTTAPSIAIGGFVGEDVETLVEIDGHPLFSISAPEVPGGPFRINAAIYDQNGHMTLQIVDNEWRVGFDTWDSEIVGPRITVRNGLGDIPLQLRCEAGKGLVIERLNLAYKGTRIIVDHEDSFRVETRSGQTCAGSSVHVKGAKVGIQITGDSLALGVSGGRPISMHIGEMHFNGGGSRALILTADYLARAGKISTKAFLLATAAR
ncbi:HNH endonuclease [Rhizorhabdus sp.]|uniref:HNH endonuclease n=1 Tax=Rhizorhabdus sp. TaxID=1968843 RepID=UPI0035B2D7A9